MEKEKIQNKLDLILKIFLGLVLSFSLIKLYLDNSEDFLWKNKESFSRKDFAICLKESGVLMYGSDTCEYCLVQKKMFGSDFSEINYINCEFEREVCEKKGIKSYPLWQDKDEKILKGVQDFKTLAEFSKCSTPL